MSASVGQSGAVQRLLTDGDARAEASARLARVGEVADERRVARGDDGGGPLVGAVAGPDARGHHRTAVSHLHVGLATPGRRAGLKSTAMELWLLSWGLLDKRS